MPNACFMTKFLLCVFILALAKPLLGQNAFRKNTLYGELAGNGIFLSLNYERQLTHKPGLGVRVGVGYASSDETFRLSIPVGVNYLLNLRNHKSFMDAGLGATWSEAAIVKSSFPGDDNSGHMVSFVPSLAYRHQTNWGLMWRLGFAPIINKYRFIPFPELSVGMSF